MRKIVLLVSFLLGLSLVTLAQDYDYGKPSELRGLTKVFIDTGVDIENRNRIVKVIEDAKILGLKILERGEAAEVIISFREDRRPRQVGRTTRYDRTDEGFVVIAATDGKRMKILMSFESTQDKAGENKPATKFAKDFVKEYKKANTLD